MQAQGQYKWWKTYDLYEAYFTTGHEVTIGSAYGRELRLPNGVWCSEAALTYKWVLSRPGAGPKAPVCVKFPEGRTNYIFIFS